MSVHQDSTVFYYIKDRDYETMFLFYLLIIVNATVLHLKVHLIHCLK